MNVNDNAAELARRLSDGFDFKEARVLEIGCGDGRVTSFLAPHCRKLIAMEYDYQTLPKGSGRPGPALFLAGSGQALPFKDNMFDYAIFTLSLHHHQDSRFALAEAERIVHSNGRIIVLEPATDGLLERMCYLFNYEEPQLIKAQNDIRSSRLVIDREDFWETDWRFDDFSSVIEWLCDCYEVSCSKEMETSVRDFLQDRADDRPLIIDDDLVLTVLKKA